MCYNNLGTALYTFSIFVVSHNYDQSPIYHKTAVEVSWSNITVENFKAIAQSGYYEGTIFHRVINGFMVQGGGLTSDMNNKSSGTAPIQNEANNGLSNDRGTIAMARTMDPHSATSQFFINHKVSTKILVYI